MIFLFLEICIKYFLIIIENNHCTKFDAAKSLNLKEITMPVRHKFKTIYTMLYKI